MKRFFKHPSMLQGLSGLSDVYSYVLMYIVVITVITAKTYV